MRSARCPAVDWVLASLGERAGGERGPAEAIDWRRVVAFASAHMVLPAVASRLDRAAVTLPPEVRQFLGDMEAANRARNEMLRAALAGIGEALSGLGERPLVLKGGAFLVETEDSEVASWRFMSDLDILVAGRDCETAVARIERLGFARSKTTGAELQAHHAPPLISPCGQFSVEVHTGLSDHGGPTPDEMRARARAVGHGLSVPSPEDRLAHAIAHAQLHNRQAVSRRLVLKDIVDIQVLGDGLAIDGGLLDRLFASPRDRWAAGGLVEAAEAFGAAPDFVATDAERAWAEGALARLRWPSWRTRLALPGDTLRLEAFRMAHEDGHMARRIAMLASPRLAGEAARVWAYKQRQRLWA
jgi:hypothetical protein